MTAIYSNTALIMTAIYSNTALIMTIYSNTASTKTVTTVMILR